MDFEEGELEDVYSDLPEIDLGAEIIKVSIIFPSRPANNAPLQQLREREQAFINQVAQLQGDIQKLCSKVSELHSERNNLARNISELYKTAKVEIARKDRTIADLQRELENFIFRRRAGQNKRAREEQTIEESEAKRTKEQAAPGEKIRSRSRSGSRCSQKSGRDRYFGRGRERNRDGDASRRRHGGWDDSKHRKEDGRKGRRSHSKERRPRSSDKDRNRNRSSRDEEKSHRTDHSNSNERSVRRQTELPAHKFEENQSVGRDRNCSHSEKPRAKTDQETSRGRGEESKTDKRGSGSDGEVIEIGSGSDDGRAAPGKLEETGKGSNVGKETSAVTQRVNKNSRKDKDRLHLQSKMDDKIRSSQITEQKSFGHELTKVGLEKPQKTKLRISSKQQEPKKKVAALQQVDKQTFADQCRDLILNSSINGEKNKTREAEIITLNYETHKASNNCESLSNLKSGDKNINDTEIISGKNNDSLNVPLTNANDSSLSADLNGSVSPAKKITPLSRRKRCIISFQD